MLGWAALSFGAGLSGCADEREVNAVDESEPGIAWEESAETTVVTLAEDAPMVAKPDAPPLLRIQGDGTVLVHYPEGSKHAGDYRGQLSQEALGALLHELEALGVLQFDADVVRERVQHARERRGPEAAVPMVADAATTRLVIRLERYAPSADAEVARGFEQRIAWYALDMDAEAYPSVEPLANLQRAVDRLKALAARFRGGRP